MRKRAADSKTTDGLMSAKRVKKDWVSGKELARLKRVADGEHTTTIEVRDATFDLWDAPIDPPKKTNEPRKEPIKQPKTMKEAPISLVASGKKVDAVPRPGGGYSYNPMFADYEQRLAVEGEKAVSAEQKRLAAEEQERVKEEARARSAAEADAAEEKANMSEWEEDSEWEGFQSGVEDDGKLSTKKRPERKTPAQRNRIKRRKEEEQLAKHKAAIKAQRTQSHNLQGITDELNEKERSKALVLAEQEAAESETEDELATEKLRRRQLGKYKLPEKDLELVLPEELEDSLRLLKPEGNLLKDRYRSMLVRGKVESRRHIPFHKQAKKKVTEKWTHKDFIL